ncbi:histone-like nucleoid-structuring protein Lsr2 [Brachybacterium tyrofermentans]|uniref:histone-like nucleoid-structuring protein Lsr2 n=1 Tax=Brachybacterium tyrofermentans TaxID=47848 RepID=UPI003FD1A4C8
MARKTRVILTDDIDHSEATDSVSFGLDGVSYEIDLNDEHARQLRDQIAAWSSKGRRVGGRRTQRPRSSKETAAIRHWAQENGYEIGDRGRISQAIRDAYAADS